MQNLLLLHGALGHAVQFEALLPLLKEKFTVYTFDFSGHGGKAMPDTINMQHFADETAEFIKNNIGSETHIFGHSMGGYVALYMARHKMAPIGNIMTLGTKLNWSPEIAANEAKMLNTEKMKEKVPAFAQSLADIHGDNWELLCQKTAEMMVGLGNNPALTNDDFTQIENLVQLGLGDRDTMVGLEETAAAYRQLPNGRLLVMPNTHHPYNKVNIERLAYEITGFMG
jgi:pimeloyl-ACP methyl ester carboxylesterase